MKDGSRDHGDFASREWFRPAGVPRRYGTRATRARRSRDGLRIYSPQRPLSRLRFMLGRLPLVRSCAVKQDAPPLPLDELVATLGINASGAVAIKGSSPERWVVGLEVSGKLAAVAKFGSLIDRELKHEADVLQKIGLADSWIRIPEVLLTGEIADRFVLVTRAAPCRTGRASLEQVAAVTTQLTKGVLGVSWVHGDLAQWNTVRVGRNIWILDWEHGRCVRLPLWDLTDHLFREGVLVGRYTPRQVVEHLTAKDSVGWRHLVDVGEDPGRSREFLLAYLNDRPTLGKSSAAFEQRMREFIQ